MFIKRHIALLLIVAGLAAPAWGQSIYALRAANRNLLPPAEPVDNYDLVQLTGIGSSEIVKVTSLMPLPTPSHIVAFDAGRQRVFLIGWAVGDGHLYVADLQTKSLTRSDFVATSLTFAFDSSRDTLFAANGALLLAVDPTSATTTTVMAADRPIALCGLDPTRGRAFVSDPGGGELRYIDLNTGTLSTALLTVDSSVSVMAETDRDVVDIVYNSGEKNYITRFDMATSTSTASASWRDGHATANALDTQSGHLYAVTEGDFGLWVLLNIDVRKGTVSGTSLSGDFFEVVVVPSVPPRRRAVRAP